MLTSVALSGQFVHDDSYCGLCDVPPIQYVDQRMIFYPDSCQRGALERINCQLGKEQAVTGRAF